MNDPFGVILEMTEKFAKPPSRGQIRKAQEDLDLARQDLTLSKLSYNAKIFNQACNHIQQSVEKATKAYYKLLGILEDTTIRGTSHDTPELFLKMVELPWVQSFVGLAENFSGTQVVADTTKAKAVIHSKIERAKIARLSSVAINKTLDLIPQIEKATAPFFPLTNKDLVMASLRLYLLASVTFPHERYSRYADEVVHPREYTPKLGIVASIKKVWNETETAISEVQQLIDYSKQIKASKPRKAKKAPAKKKQQTS